jgi:hypothetical protein
VIKIVNFTYFSQMKVQILGFFAFIAVVNAGVVPYVGTTTTLLRSPVLDNAVVHSERIGDSFAYSTVTANGYTQYVQGVSAIIQ